MQKDNNLLYRLFANINDEDTAGKAFDVILSDDEQAVLSDRLSAALMFEQGKSASDIAAECDSSAIIVSKVKETLIDSGLDFTSLTAAPPSNPYSVFAEIYDSLTEDVEYEKRADYIVKLVLIFLEVLMTMQLQRKFLILG